MKRTGGRKEQKKRDASARKGRKVAEHCFFHWFVAPEGRKVGSLKRRVRSHLARWEMKNCTPLWREADFKVKKLKAPHVRRTFGGSDVEKKHAVLARSTFRCQNVQNTCSDHLWKSGCWKSAHRFGAKHFPMSKCTKHMFGPPLEVEMLKKRTPWWCEAHVEVKMYKTHVRTTFGNWDVQKVHVVARSKFPSQNAQSTTCSDHRMWFLRGRCKGFGRHSARDMFMRHFVWPGLIFNAWQAQNFRQIEWKTAKRIGMRPSALHSIFHFWRKSRRIA